MRGRVVLLSIVIAAFCAAPIAAQDSVLVREGDWIRLTTRVGLSHDSQRGRVVGFSRDSVVLRACELCAFVPVAVSDVSTVQVLSGVSSPSMASLLGWGAVGAVITSAAWIGFVMLDKQGCHDGPCGAGVIFTPYFALGGGLAGMAIGAAIPTSRWVPGKLTGR